MRADAVYVHPGYGSEVCCTFCQEGSQLPDAVEGQCAACISLHDTGSPPFSPARLRLVDTEGFANAPELELARICDRRRPCSRVRVAVSRHCRKVWFLSVPICTAPSYCRIAAIAKLDFSQHRSLLGAARGTSVQRVSDLSDSAATAGYVQRWGTSPDLQSILPFDPGVSYHVIREWCLVYVCAGSQSAAQL